MKKLIYLLVLWFLIDWAFFNKIKPFIIDQFGLGAKQTITNTTVVDTSAIDTSGYAYGLDISHYQGKETRLPFTKKDNISFVICKAAEGATGVDPTFRYNLKNIQAEGLIWGAYHFYLSKDSGETQANHFLEVVKAFSNENLPPIVDVEDSLINKGQLLLFLSVIKRATNRTPLIYTNYECANAYLNDTAFAKYPLWIAHYSNTPPLLLPAAWKGQAWNFWQKSANYYVNSTANDFDVFNGSVEDLKKFISSH